MKRLILIISVSGLLFSGYLSFYKLFSDTCAFGESCPLFLGLPACYLGFAMYVLLTVLSAGWFLKKVGEKSALKLIIAISFLGILFAGYFTLGELPLLFENGFSAYFFGLPTCALGLIFYILIFVLGLKNKH